MRSASQSTTRDGVDMTTTGKLGNSPIKILLIDGLFYRTQKVGEDEDEQACDKCVFIDKPEKFCNKLMRVMPDESSCCDYETYYKQLGVEDLSEVSDEQLEKARGSEIHTTTY